MFIIFPDIRTFFIFISPSPSLCEIIMVLEMKININRFMVNYYADFVIFIQLKTRLKNWFSSNSLLELLDEILHNYICIYYLKHANNCMKW